MQTPSQGAMLYIHVCSSDRHIARADGRIVKQVGVVNTSASALAMASGGHMEHALLLAGHFMEAGHQVRVIQAFSMHCIHQITSCDWTTAG